MRWVDADSPARLRYQVVSLLNEVVSESQRTRLEADTPPSSNVKPTNLLYHRSRSRRLLARLFGTALPGSQLKTTVL